jgi:1-acyl-sn-glycerol-3-phosphate acyltransferase
VFHWLPPTLRGVVSIIFYAVNTIFFCTPLFLVTLLKFIVPVPAWQRFCSRVLNVIATAWVDVNNFHQQLTGKTIIRVCGVESLKPRDWYLVISNHQSWVDILVLQRVFNHKIPMLKFFIKKQLMWFPIMGQAWWALDFPFMQRHSREEVKKNPALAGQDLAITRQACRKFKDTPVTVMNFVEGTRFTSEKHRRQQSSYKNLLRPKAGGTAFVLGAMGDHLRRLVDVTIVYPSGPKSFWAFLCGRVREVRVCVRSLPIAPEMLGDYFGDRDFRSGFQEWINNLWDQKDQRIQAMMKEGFCLAGDEAVDHCQARIEAGTAT